MIQIYNPENTDYDSNGDMTLFPLEAAVHTVLNGSWYAELEHPIDREGRWKYIQEEAVIKMPSFNGVQLFRIRSKEKSDSGVVCEMEPIFFDSIGDCFLEDIRPTGKNGQEALDLMTSPNTKYSGQSNITRTATAYYQFKNLMEAINGEEDNSFINRWGGEILFDNFKVIIDERVGGDYGVELRYGKNIPQDGLKEEIDTRSVVTRIYPKAYNGYTMTNKGHVDSEIINNYPTIKSKTITFSDVKMKSDAQENDQENGVIICRSQEEIDAALIKKCKEQYDAGIDKPKITISANMILLKDTDLYAEYKVLEEVSLGDTIHCHHSRLGITIDARVIELEYDSIRKKVASVVLGDFQYNYFNNVSSAVNRIDQVIRTDGTVMAEKIAGFINGAMASLKAQYNIAKKQDVIAILFENLEEENPLFGALAIGTQGILISKQRTLDGKSWEWATALTAGGLVANIIIAGILSDKTGKNYWNLDTGEFALSAEGFTIDGKDAKDYFEENWSQEEIFNKLTQNGKEQGIYMKDGRIYVNATYVDTGILAGWKIDKENQKITSPDGTIILDAKNNKITTKAGENGNRTTIEAGKITSGRGNFSDINVGTGAIIGSNNASHVKIRDGFGDKISEINIQGKMYVSNETIELYALQHSSGGYIVFASDGKTLAYYASSSKRYKEHIGDMSVEDARKILDTTPVWFRYKEGYLDPEDELCGKEIPGFYAEDIAEHYEMGARYKDGVPEDWREKMMIPAIVKLLQDHEERIRKSERRNQN